MKERDFRKSDRLLNRTEATYKTRSKKIFFLFGSQRKCSHCLNKDNCHQKYLCNMIPDKVKCSQCKFCSYAVRLCPNYKVNINCEL